MSQQPLKLLVTNLSPFTTAESLGHLFERYGAVKNAELITDGSNSLCYGYVEMNEYSASVDAFRNLNGATLDGSSIVIQISNEHAPRQYQSNPGYRQNNSGSSSDTHRPAQRQIAPSTQPAPRQSPSQFSPQQSERPTSFVQPYNDSYAYGNSLSWGRGVRRGRARGRGQSFVGAGLPPRGRPVQFAGIRPRGPSSVVTSAPYFMPPPYPPYPDMFSSYPPPAGFIGRRGRGRGRRFRGRGGAAGFQPAAVAAAAAPADTTTAPATTAPSTPPAATQPAPQPKQRRTAPAAPSTSSVPAAQPSERRPIDRSRPLSQTIVHVANLPRRMGREEFAKVFSEKYQVKNTILMLIRSQPPLNVGHGLLELASHAEQERLLRELPTVEIGGRQCTLTAAILTNPPPLRSAQKQGESGNSQKRE